MFTVRRSWSKYGGETGAEAFIAFPSASLSASNAALYRQSAGAADALAKSSPLVIGQGPGAAGGRPPAEEPGTAAGHTPTPPLPSESRGGRGKELRSVMRRRLLYGTVAK